MSEKLYCSEDKLLAKICRNSFYDFVKEFWDVIIPENPVWNWHIKYICDELQIMAERVFKKEDKIYDLIINIPPGTTKSTICSVMYPAWIWTRMPSARIIAGSHTANLSLDLSRKSRLIINSEKYSNTFPEIQLSGDQSTKSYFVNTANGARLATMVGGVPTGFHAHFLIVDDPIDPKGATSDAELKASNDWMKETLSTRKVDKGVAITILIMQRLHEIDPTGDWIKRSNKEDLKHINLPAELSESTEPSEIIPFYKDGLLDPIRLSKKILEQQKRDLGEFGYACQFDQTPIPRGGGEFKTSRIQVELAPPLKWLARVRYWDKAGTKDGGCYTAGVLMGLDRHNFVWILNVMRGQWDAFEREQNIKQAAEQDGELVRIYVEQEPGSGGKESAENTIRNLVGHRIYADRPTGNKETRAEPFACSVNGNLVRMIKAEWNYAYINELMHWPMSGYKDQVDASSGAYNKLTKPKKKAGAL